MNNILKDIFIETFTHPVSGSNIAYNNTDPAKGPVMTNVPVKILLRENGLYHSINLSGTDLSGFSLKGTDLSGAIFANANLSGVNFTGANLNGAIFTNANVTGAIFNGATTVGANFSGVTYQTPPSGINVTNAGGPNAN